MLRWLAMEMFDARSDPLPKRPLQEVLAAEPGRICTSEWMTVDEERLRSFEVGTFVTKDDMDYTIPGNSPIEGRYVDGFLLVGLIIHFHWNLFPFRDPDTWALNYGVDRVRFPATVWVGERLRCHIDLLSSEEREEGQTMVTTRSTLEVEGKDKPAMVADWRCLFFDGDAPWEN